MNIKILKKKKCYIFPKSPMSKVLSNHLIKNDVFFQGFIDNNITSSDSCSLFSISQTKFDYILILSPRHMIDIYEQTLKTISANKIICVHLNSKTSSYDFFFNPQEIIDQIKTKATYIQSYFDSKFVNHLENKLENEILLIGLDFLDLNIKYLYLYIKNNTNIKVHLACNNLRDIEIFKQAGIDATIYPSQNFVDLVFRCRVKIVDHSPTDKFLIDCINIGKSVQLWHGVTVKMLGTQTNYKALKYNIVLSTSPFVTEYSFSKLYDYEHIIHCGYPRNDILYNDDIDLINVNVKLLKEMQNDSFKYVVYMPTYRPLGFEENPIEYQNLNDFAKTNNIKFIIKMHPFIAEKTREGLKDYTSLASELNHLIFYEANMDIYPLLKYSDLLLADYSSVYFDYLYLNKPIVFFPYDYEKWKESADGVMLDYFTHSPGDKCYTYDEMKQDILKNLNIDSYKNTRKQIHSKMFDNKNKKASQLIVHEIQRLLFNADI